MTNDLRQTQKQTMTMTLAPQQRQSLHMLQLSLPDLRAELYGEMAQNPVIEDIEQTIESSTTSQKEEEAAEKAAREKDSAEAEKLEA